MKAKGFSIIAMASIQGLLAKNLRPLTLRNELRLLASCLSDEGRQELESLLSDGTKNLLRELHKRVGLSQANLPKTAAKAKSVEDRMEAEYQRRIVAANAAAVNAVANAKAKVAEPERVKDGASESIRIAAVKAIAATKAKARINAIKKKRTLKEKLTGKK